MSVDAVSLQMPQGRDVFNLKRSSLSLFWAIVSDPLRGLPPSVFDHRITVARNFGRTRAYVCDPALIHEAIVRTSERLSKGEEINRVLSPALGAGLLTADGAHWRWQRQAVAPAFQHEKLQALLPAIIAAAGVTRDRWLAAPSGARVDVGHEMTMTTFEIIIETMLSGPGGLDATRVERGITDYLGSTSWRLALALLQAPHWVPFPGSGRAKAATRLMRKSVRDMIAARRAAPSERRDLVALLLDAADPETGRRMTDDEMTDNLLTFIAAGHETTAVALCWTFGLLADAPDVLARLRAEVDDVTGGGPLEPRHVAELAYTRQVVSEAMRLYPPAPLISRSTLDTFDLGGVTMPKGSIIIVPIYAVHRHKALWADPERFDPDRFAPAAVRARHRYAFMPFGAGPRICIGSAFAMMEAVAILAVLVQAVRFERLGAAMPGAKARVTLRPKVPLEMRVAAR